MLSPSATRVHQCGARLSDLQSSVWRDAEPRIGPVIGREGGQGCPLTQVVLPRRSPMSIFDFGAGTILKGGNGDRPCARNPRRAYCIKALKRDGELQMPPGSLRYRRPKSAYCARESNAAAGNVLPYTTAGNRDGLSEARRPAVPAGLMPPGFRNPMDLSFSQDGTERLTPAGRPIAALWFDGLLRPASIRPPQQDEQFAETVERRLRKVMDDAASPHTANAGTHWWTWFLCRYIRVRTDHFFTTLSL